jgi:putative CocE/NonD family hydrolase
MISQATLALLASTSALAGSSPTFHTCRPDDTDAASGSQTSYYVTMRDGVRIAVDVLLPARASAAPVPAVLEMTRYWRRAEGSGPTEEQLGFMHNGYAVVTGDVRGTGASFGTWPYHRSRPETLDFGELIAWVAKQSWSNGRVVGYGVSYSANTADWMPERQNPALKAVDSRFPDYDPYADLYFPGGIANRWMIETWGSGVRQLDLNERVDANGTRLPGIRPVDSVNGTQLLADAIEQRRNVPSVAKGLEEVRFRDDRPPSWDGASMDDWGIYSVRSAVEHSQTPIQSWASWFDAGTADGVLHRFMTQTNPQRVFIGAWAHGGHRAASPFMLPASTSPDPSYADQIAEDNCFFDRFARSKNAPPLQPKKLLTYYTLGAELWKTTEAWPLPHTKKTTWYFASQKRLTAKESDAAHPADRYPIDYTASTGAKNRWHTNGGVPEVVYGDRSEEDHKLLTYTSEPLSNDVEITGQPLVSLYVEVDRDDAAFFVYLEEVDQHGVVRYLTEGEMRAIDRKNSTRQPPYTVIGPYHSFKREDAEPLTPGQVTEVAFSMMPISALIRAGHRIRIALAGADADTFERIPQTGETVFHIYSGGSDLSHVVLPLLKP